MRVVKSTRKFIVLNSHSSSPESSPESSPGFTGITSQFLYAKTEDHVTTTCSFSTSRDSIIQLLPDKMKLLFVATLSVIAAVCYSQTPTRPVIPETFKTTVSDSSIPCSPVNGVLLICRAGGD